MKKIITISLLSLAFSINAQIQENAPWVKSNQTQKKGKLTLDDISKSAENYFNTIDRNKKGSGLKPFERWKYNWSHYLNEDGTIAPASNLWKSWERKNAMNSSEQKKSDVSNWVSRGPFTHTNTGSWGAGQGRVNAIAVDPSNSNTYYIGSPAGGIWKSTDAGLNWKPLTDFLPQIGVSGIAIHPTNSNIIYIATGDDDANDSYAVGVWKSTDGGTTWNNTGAIPGNPNNMSEIYINPNSPETVLVATNTGVQKTINGGTTWTTVLNGNFEDIKMKPGDPTVWYALSDTKFYKSTNSGDSFTEKTISGLSGSTRMTMDVTKANAEYIYIVSAGSGNSFNGVYKSTDSGETFSKTFETSNIFESTQAWYDLALTTSSDNADIVYVGVLNIWKSSDGGNNFSKINEWNQPNSASYTHADIHFLRFIDNKFFAGTDGGVYVSTNEGSTFTSLTDNLAISQFYRISVSPQNSSNVVGGLQDNGGYAFSDNSWKNYHGADGMDCAVNPLDSKTYYGFIQYGGSLYRTTDAGATRSSIRVSAPSSEAGGNDSGGEWITPMAINNKGELFSGYKNVYKLINNAWVKTSSLFLSDDIDVMAIDPNNVNNMYFGERNSLYKSTDEGVNFNQVSFNNGTIRGIEVHKENSNIVWVTTSNGVYKTENMNESSPTFTSLTNNIPSESKLVVRHHLRSGNNTIYLGTTLGVYYYNDTTNEWRTFDNNLPNTQIRDLEINEDDSILYAATYGRGVFSTEVPRILPPSDIKLVSIDNPKNGALMSSNSFAPEITIKNEGTEAITSAVITYNVNGNNEVTYNWNGNLNSGQTIKITLPDYSTTIGEHRLNVTANINNDKYSSNNSLQTPIIVNEFNSKPTTINGFEQSGDELLYTTTNQTMWELGTVNKTLLKTPTGNKAYATKINGNYPDKTKGYLYSKFYDMSNIQNPVLKFNMGFDIEQDWDYLYIEYSTDKGVNWNILGNASDSNWYNSSSTQNNLPGKQWTGEGEDSNSRGGTNATIREYSYDLASFKNEKEFIYRFVFVADDATNEEGVVIDDLVIEGTLSNNDPTVLNAVSIFPNPSDDIFNLRWTTGDNLNIKVYDITGKQIFSKKDLNDSNYKLNMSNFAKGIYLLNMEMNGKSATKKLILK